MNILSTGLQYNRYNPAQGTCFEYEVILPAWRAMPNCEVTYAPYDDILKVGVVEWRKNLINQAREGSFDMMFVWMYTDEIDPKTFNELRKYTTVVAWFSDDHWRIYNYSLQYAPHIDWIITTYSKAPAIYAEHGITNVIRSQWAFNLQNSKIPDEITPTIPVSFVGLWSAPREKLIRTVRSAGIEVLVRGRGWPEGGVSREEMERISANSKISLGINTPPGRWSIQSLGRLFLRRSRNKLVLSCNIIKNIQAWLGMNIPQVKARHFEIPACGGLLMAAPADDLQNYLEFGSEIVVYHSSDDMIQKIQYYLSHEDERAAIAKAGHLRTIKHHTYQQRFTEILETIHYGSKPTYEQKTKD